MCRGVERRNYLSPVNEIVRSGDGSARFQSLFLFAASNACACDWFFCFGLLSF